MRRRSFLKTVPPALWTSGLALAGGPEQASFPAVPALVEAHFPSRLYLFVWRNWELANLDRMAQVVGGTARELEALGRAMGLPPKARLSNDYLKRIYITVIRQNWHVLPEAQIRELLGWDRAKFEFTLKEDDFLDVKLGRVKPACEPLRYQAPTAAERRRAGEIRTNVERWFGRELRLPAQPRFSFVAELSALPPPLPGLGGAVADPGEIELGQGWRYEVTGGGAALTSAVERFRDYVTNGGASSRETRTFGIAVARGGDLRPGDFRVQAEAGGVRITAPTERAAIRALYHLRGAMDQRHLPVVPRGEAVSREVWSPRFLYSYFALYGDPLMEGDAAGLPDGYLDRAAASGVEGVWVQGVLNTLAPSPAFPEFGNGWEIRLKNLRALVARAAKYGMRVFLYLNEPRAMPEAFFRERAEMRGDARLGLYTMCTSNETVRAWIRDSLALVFREAPGLGGVFTITMSENPTNCFSHGGAWGDRNPVAAGCPRCSKRTGAEVIAELIGAMRDGIRSASDTAEIMSYDWGWGTPLAEALIPRLPKDTSVLSISEWSQPVSRGGVKTVVGEYSMSVVGPGPRAAKNWALAQKAGLRTVAKTQFNNTWEISAVPYIPVLPLVLDHCEGLAKAGVGGVMASWTCGGFPSPNLQAAGAFASEPRPARELILGDAAERIYGAEGAAKALEAWGLFSEAFQMFPYGVAIYILPTQHGPANLLRIKPTGLKPGMILFPYDQYQSWKGAYPAETVQRLMAQMTAKWSAGVEVLKQAGARAPAGGQKAAQLEFAIAQTCQTHFESTANQIEFYLLRDERAAAGKDRRLEIRGRMIALAERERELGRAQFLVARRESLIGYEASNHYYYTPWDLVEKMLNCEQVIAELKRS
jgi:hypothetical protein